MVKKRRKCSMCSARVERVKKREKERESKGER